MKVALLTPTFFNFSGIDRVVKHQAGKLIENGNKVDIFAFAADMEPPRGANLHIIGMPKSLFWQRIYRLLFPLDLMKNARISEELAKFDIIYSHQYPMNWLAYQAKNRFSVRYIYYDYGIAPPESFTSLLERLYMAIFTLLSNWTTKKADGAISISYYLKEELEKDTGLVSEVIYPSIDFSRFHKDIDEFYIRQKYNLRNCPVVLYIGRISPHKGIHLLIKAFKAARSVVPDARLIIAGKHTFEAYSRELKSLADESIILAGYVTDEEIPLYYAACTVYASATLWEGFNLPIAEAQACGKPVVAFDLGPHPEVVIKGETGYLVKTADISEMSNAITRLLEDPDKQREMGNKGYAFIREKFK